MSTINNRLSAPTEAKLIDFIETLLPESEERETVHFASNSTNGIYCVVLLPQIVLEKGTYNEEGEEITPPVYSDRFHADILANRLLDLPEGIQRHTPTNPQHGFA